MSKVFVGYVCLGGVHFHIGRDTVSAFLVETSFLTTQVTYGCNCSFYFFFYSEVCHVVPTRPVVPTRHGASHTSSFRWFFCPHFGTLLDLPPLRKNLSCVCLVLVFPSISNYLI